MEMLFKGFSLKSTQSPAKSPAFSTRGLISRIWLPRRFRSVSLARLAIGEISLI